MLRRYAVEMYDKYCRFCGTCEASCPHEVAVADVMRYAMYFRYYGREKAAMRHYRSLAGAPRRRVIGAGMAGLTVARELVRAGLSVIVVEGGDRIGSPGSHRLRHRPPRGRPGRSQRRRGDCDCSARPWPAVPEGRCGERVGRQPAHRLGRRSPRPGRLQLCSRRRRRCEGDARGRRHRPFAVGRGGNRVVPHRRDCRGGLHQRSSSSG